ncbi:MAG: hypothetical protein M3R38_28195 [Actinomycetota bacterium]|nr:hypothetical protein [Actinomycetota bacterium]
MTNRQATFEIEAGTMERFLELLRSREDERLPSEDETLPRRAVFVAPIRHARTDETGIPVVSRRVRAAFAYGPDLVTLSYLTSHDYEFPSPAHDARKNHARQDEILEKTRARVEEGLRDAGLSLPVVVAWLRLPAGEGRKDN